MYDRTSKDLDRSISDYLAVSRGRQHFASESDYRQAEDRSWAVLMDALVGMGHDQAGASPDEISIARSRS